MIGENQIEVTIKLEPFIFKEVTKMAEEDKRTISDMIETLLFERISPDAAFSLVNRKLNKN